MGPIGGSELEGAAHQGRADGMAVAANFGGSSGASATAVDQRKGGGRRWWAHQ
jgi:hypothetical protein